MRRAPLKKRIVLLLSYLVMSVLAAIYLMPFIRSAVASFMTWSQASAFPPEWVPNPFTLENYAKLFRLSLFPRWVLNTALVSGLVVAANIVTSATAGYAFAFLRFPGKNKIFSALLALLMVPPFITLIPNYILVVKMGLIDNLFGLAFLGSASVSGIFLMRQYYLSLGRELFEAARLDGAGPLRAFVYVALPLSKPALGALAIYQFLGAWNSFLGPLVFLRSPENYTLPVGLNFAFSRSMWTEYTPIIAGSLLASLPTIILYVLLNKYMIRGVVVSAKKG
ncbi:carbohydrate ABC transporter permease [Thermofilum pendens]|uniref:Binding-protein-dependent transport systems inner membrane component n=1 Tax=Thermofilum pendens (strain DSM 2475 / Hrk 5) TaxID=368408 RepID=A1RZB8_THEPD|nr:carbohydrate ABC transporter permease [Thermofilum pendens]ABL78548.1 binding-protein-dependent transport systems inner membrane component [Thermofilum pendens Hrk 5]